MKVSLVLTNYDGKDILARCLPGVVHYARTGDPVDEVIVVENGSTDGSYDFLLSNFPTVKVVRVSHNRGFAPGANAGFRAARNPRVLLLSNDMVPVEGCVEQLLPHLEDPEVFAATPRQLNSDGTTYLAAGGLAVKWGVPKPFWQVNPDSEEEPSQPVTHFGGGNFFVQQGPFSGTGWI